MSKPKPSLIKTDNNGRQYIAVASLQEKDIASYDCASIEIYGLGIVEYTIAEIVRDRYKANVDVNHKFFKRDIKNSWKGLVQFLASLYISCSNQGDCEDLNFKGLGSILDTKLLIRPDFYDMKRVNGRGSFVKFELEHLPIPASSEESKKYYVLSRYDDANALNFVNAFCNAFKFDLEQSKIYISERAVSPKRYTSIILSEPVSGDTFSKNPDIVDTLSPEEISKMFAHKYKIPINPKND